jgi:hypothetical protein
MGGGWRRCASEGGGDGGLLAAALLNRHRYHQVCRFNVFQDSASVALQGVRQGVSEDS